MSTTELIDTAEIARILGVSRAHCVGRLIKRPDFPRPAVNISQRLRRWQRDAVMRWIVKATPQRQQPTPGSKSKAAGAAPAVTNAIFAATGKRIRSLPIGDQLA